MRAYVLLMCVLQVLGTIASGSALLAVSDGKGVRGSFDPMPSPSFVPFDLRRAA